MIDIWLYELLVIGSIAIVGVLTIVICSIFERVILKTNTKLFE